MGSKIVGWLGLTFTLGGVAMQALTPSILGYSYLVSIVGSVLWIANGFLTRNRPLVVTNAILLILNIIAAFRWFA